MAVYRQSGADIPRDDLNVYFYNHPGTMQFSGSILAPMFPVNKNFGRPGILPAGASMRRVGRDQNRRGRNGTYNRVQFEVGRITYNTEVRGNEHVVDDEMRLEYEGEIDLEQVASRLLGNGQLVEHEYDVSDLLFDTGIWTGATNTSAVGTLWSTAETCTPIDDVLNVLRTIRNKNGLNSRRHLVAALHNDAWRAVWRSKQLRDIRSQNEFKSVPDKDNAAARAALAEAWNLRDVVVLELPTVTSGFGESALTWDDPYPRNRMQIMVHAEDGRDPTQPSLLRTMVNERSAGFLSFYEYEAPGVEGKVIKVKSNRDVLSFGLEYGFLLTGLLA